MTQVTLKKVWVGVKETKFGEKEQVAIQTTDHGDKYLSTFKVTPEMKQWKAGDSVEINITQKGDFLNFDTGAPSAESLLGDRVTKLEAAVFGTGIGKGNSVRPVAQEVDVPTVDFGEF